MKKNKQMVDWYAYAQKYDLLLTYNPFYQELRKIVLQKLKDWKVPDEGIIAEVGAGTGNYSVAAARLFPQAQIFHIDNNKGMNEIAAEKSSHLQNLQIIDQPIDQVNFAPNSLHGLICINALYTFPNPYMELQRMYDWLAPGARIILVDPGRIMSIFSWKLAIAWHLIKNYGLSKTLEVFREGKAVSQQNAYIRAMQKNGTFWTHTPQEFYEAVRHAGFHIEASKTCFRGDCDLVSAQKPQTLTLQWTPYLRCQKVGV